MSYYQNYLKHYTKLNFYISQISVWIKSNQIDRIYHALLSAEKEIQFMYPILKELNYPAPESFELALKNIAIQKALRYPRTLFKNRLNAYPLFFWTHR